MFAFLPYSASHFQTNIFSPRSVLSMSVPLFALLASSKSFFSVALVSHLQLCPAMANSTPSISVWLSSLLFNTAVEWESVKFLFSSILANRAWSDFSPPVSGYFVDACGLFGGTCPVVRGNWRLVAHGSVFTLARWGRLIRTFWKKSSLWFLGDRVYFGWNIWCLLCILSVGFSKFLLLSGSCEWTYGWNSCAFYQVVRSLAAPNSLFPCPLISFIS